MMMPALGLSKIQMGEVFSSFLIGYALFQSPAGAIGDIIGPRLTLGIAFLLWGLTTIATGLVPHPLLAGVNVTLVSLIVVRALLGAGEAATFPVATAVVHRWMPPAEHAFGNSLLFMGSSLGAAVATPLVSWLMVKTGWRGSFYCTAILALLIAPVWLWYLSDFQAGNQTAQQINPARPRFFRSADIKQTLSHMADKNILFLILSYFSEGYVLFIFVFWLYIYLVEKRGFTVLSGGMISALPWLTACAMAPLGGILSDRISTRIGRIAASRFVIAIGYVFSGLLLLLAAYSPYRS
ncbi:MAG TPA: MFS transporter, partial [Acidobacteriaceae bacterium]|nr:MFS transporter [Acidobacteriaceae bacterium]